jgi:hypothetical protein
MHFPVGNDGAVLTAVASLNLAWNKCVCERIVLCERRNQSTRLSEEGKGMFYSELVS